jgi:hypothetical protein
MFDPFLTNTGFLLKKNVISGYYPIHHAVRNLAVQNIIILLKADAYCANQTLNLDKTPLHLLVEVLNDTNLPKVFEIIQIFSKFGGNFSWPARQSGYQTPFSMLLERLATRQDKAICIQIIRFLIGKYQRIDSFQREKCANLIQKYFKELADDYQVIESWKEETNENMDWKSELAKLIEENEAVFLVKFDFQMKCNLEELRENLFDGLLIFQAIEHDKFESFVEIYSLNCSNFDVGTVARGVLGFNRWRMLNYLLNHDSVEYIDPKWMINILWQMKDKEIDNNPNTLKCFHTLLNHRKYDVNEQFSDIDNITVLHFAATQSEYATVELLKGGASLSIRNKSGHMAIQSLTESALKKFFDSCVTKSIPGERSDFYFMIFDYSFLKESKEMPLIEYMTETKEMHPFIEHPVIASFLFLKWLRLSNIFYLNLLLFSLSAVSFSTYLSLFYVNPYLQDSTNHIWFQLSLSLAYGSLMIFAVKEIGQFIASPTRYMKSAENYFEIIFMLLMSVSLFTSIKDQQIRRAIAAVLFMGFAVEWTLMFSALPIFSVSNYIVMLKKVAVNFLRTLAFYSIILMAFVLSFYTLLNKSEEVNENSGESNGTGNSTIFSTFFHVILMLTGDFEKITEDVKDVFIGRMFLIIFVLSMSIVMMNLLIGLTVSDTAAIGREAEWYKWCQRAKMLGKYECMAGNW